jgi:trk system potassium uptake protein TrkA
MAQTQQVAVLGLGRFGSAVARELTRLGHEVLAIDTDERIVQEIAEDVTHAAQADITEEAALQELGLADFDAAILAISSNLEVSILATVLLRQLGTPIIVAKAATQLHGSILAQVGATRVVYPEHDTGVRVAHSFAAPGVHDYLSVAPGYGIALFDVPEDWFGKTVGELIQRSASGVAIVAVYRASSVTLNPDASETLRAGDRIVVAGVDESLESVWGPDGTREDGPRSR